MGPITMAGQQTVDGDVLVQRFPVDAARAQFELRALFSAGGQQARKPGQRDRLERLLGFDPVEKPLALQLGGDDPGLLAAAARLAAARPPEPAPITTRSKESLMGAGSGEQGVLQKGTSQVGP